MSLHHSPILWITVKTPKSNAYWKRLHWSTVNFSGFEPPLTQYNNAHHITSTSVLAQQVERVRSFRLLYFWLDSQPWWSTRLHTYQKSGPGMHACRNSSQKDFTCILSDPRFATHTKTLTVFTHAKQKQTEIVLALLSPVGQRLAVMHLHCPRLLEPCLDAAERWACVSPGLTHDQTWSHLAVRAVPTPPQR